MTRHRIRAGRRTRRPGRTDRPAGATAPSADRAPLAEPRTASHTGSRRGATSSFSARRTTEVRSVTSPDIRLLGPRDAHVLDHVARGVFDNEIDPHWTEEFLADPRHHLAVAVDDGVVVGMASG